jgi:hypothetical protein
MMDFFFATRRSAAACRLRPAALAGLCAATLLLVACGPVGSGGTGAPVGAAGTSFAQGPVNGFGSILVDSVHYDDSTAQVVDDDGNPLSAQADIHLGSNVDVQAVPTTGATATATLIRVRTDLIGPVSTAYDPSTQVLGVLGQPVLVDPATTFVDGVAGGLGQVATGAVVSVSSLYDPVAGIYHATRIAPNPGATSYAIRGAVQALGAGTVEIGGQSFDYGSLAAPADFQIGQLVRLTLHPQPTDLGHWSVASVMHDTRAPADRSAGDVRGAVGKVIDGRHAFVAGVLVDAGNATFVPADRMLDHGDLVQVHGTMAGAVLLATRVDFPVAGAPLVGGENSGGSRYDTGFEITGTLLSGADPDTRTFTMRGPTTVDYTSAQFHGGSAADLVQGSTADVVGSLSADGSRLLASTIRIGG